MQRRRIHFRPKIGLCSNELAPVLILDECLTFVPGVENKGKIDTTLIDILKHNGFNVYASVNLGNLFHGASDKKIRAVLEKMAQDGYPVIFITSDYGFIKKPHASFRTVLLPRDITTAQKHLNLISLRKLKQFIRKSSAEDASFLNLRNFYFGKVMSFVSAAGKYAKPPTNIKHRRRGNLAPS